MEPPLSGYVINLHTASAFPCTPTLNPHSIPEPFCNAHFITRPFICALPSKDTRIQSYDAQLQAVPRDVGSWMESREISRRFIAAA